MILVTITERDLDRAQNAISFSFTRLDRTGWSLRISWQFREEKSVVFASLSDRPKCAGKSSSPGSSIQNSEKNLD